MGVWWSGYDGDVPYWIAGDLLMRSPTDPPTQIDVYDWVEKRWVSRGRDFLERLDSDQVQRLTAVAAGELIANP